MAGCNFNCGSCGVHGSSDNCDEMELKMRGEMEQAHTDGRDFTGYMTAVAGAAAGFICALIIFRFINVAIAEVSSYVLVLFWVALTIVFEILIGRGIEKRNKRRESAS